MPQSPLKQADLAPFLEVKLDGREINDKYGIQSVSVCHAIDNISTAQLQFVAGNPVESGSVAITDSGDFDPGTSVEIFAGYAGEKSTSIFKGIIVKQSIKLDAQTPFLTTIECRHEAVKMAYNEMEGFFEDKKDDAIIKEIIGQHNIAAGVGSCGEVHACSIQKSCTDWDFILALCRFNGFIVTMDSTSGMVLDKPDFSGPPALEIEAGNSMISFDGTLNAEFQPAGINAAAWDPQSLSLISAAAAEPTINAQGQVLPKSFASKLGQGELSLLAAAPLPEQSLQQWADGALLRKRLSAFTGTAKFAGSALAKTGTVIEVKGVGKAMSGKAFISGVTHVLDAQGWVTTVTFGLGKESIPHSADTLYNRGAGQLPAMQGLQLGTVLQVENDPENQYRVLLQIPSLAREPNNIWARMAHNYASKNAGFFFLPETGDEVVLAFLDNDVRFPVILGALYSSANAPGYNGGANNNIKAIVTRSRMKIEFDEDKKNISVSTPGGNSIVLSDDGKSIILKDQNQNSITLGTGGIVLDSAKDIKISAKGNIAIKGLNVDTSASGNFKVTAKAAAELSAGGQTTIKGAIVTVN